MKILQVMAGAEHGGAETAFVDMCLALHAAGEHVEVVTRANAIRVPRLHAAGIKVHTLPFGGKIDVFTRWAMPRIIGKFRPDIVQSWMSRAPGFVPRWQAKMNIPRYLHVARLGSPYKLKYFKNADYFITITPGIKTYMEQGGIEPARVRHINNFAEVEPAQQPLHRADYDTPEDAPLLLGLGRLHDAKAFDTLIRVAANIPAAHVWIAGEGPARGMLENLIRELGLGLRVKLLGWREDRAALLQASDICMFISRNEGFGAVFVQAWAQKTPVVVCDADGPRQYVSDGQDGLVCPIDDVGAITAAARRLIDDPALAHHLTEKGYQRYESEFTVEACLQKYLEWYVEARIREGLPPAA